MMRQIRAKERWNEATNWGTHSDKRCRWLSLPTFNPSKWTGRTLQQWWRLFIQVSVKPVNPWAQHWRSMPDLWQVYEEILSIVWPESCNVIHALFSINLERSFPNKKSASFHYQLSNERVPPNSMATVWCIHKYSSTLNTGQGDLCNAKGLVEPWSIQRCNHAIQAIRQLEPDCHTTSPGPYQSFDGSGSKHKWCETPNRVF